MLPDIGNVIAAMPDALPTKKEEASLYLYAGSCGARASTCAEVRLQDIISVIIKEDGYVMIEVKFIDYKKNFCLLTCIRCFKGSPNLEILIKQRS
jgi:hypothetical protein